MQPIVFQYLTSYLTFNILLLTRKAELQNFTLGDLDESKGRMKGKKKKEILWRAYTHNNNSK